MASTWSNLGLRLMATGENDNTWGAQTNDNWNRMEDSTDGYISVALSSTTHTATFTTQPTSYASEEGRKRVINYTGSPGGTCTVTLPNIEKVFVVRNNTDQSLIFTAGTGAQTVTLASGFDAQIYVDGSDEVHNCFDQMTGSVPTTSQVVTALSGATLTGALTIDNTFTANSGGTFGSNVSITTADNTDTLKLVSTDADASAGPVLVLDRASGSPQDGDLIGRVIYRSRNDAGEELDLVKTSCFIADASDGTEDAQFEIDQRIAGTYRNMLTTSASQIIFNEDSQDIDFRVESDGNTHMLFVDAGNDHVNIGTATDGGGTLNVNGLINYLESDTLIGGLTSSSSDLILRATVQDKDMKFTGNDGGATITALTLDMSEAGAATFNNNVTAFSDERLKTDIKTIESGLDKVSKMRGVTFKRDDKLNSGVIAQELEKIAPELVKTADDEMGTKSVAYGNMVAYLIEAVKELKVELDNHKKNCHCKEE